MTLLPWAVARPSISESGSVRSSVPVVMPVARKMPLMVFDVPAPSHRAASSALATSVTSRVRSTASRPTTEVRISSLLSFTNTLRPLRVEGSRVTSSNATSPSLIWAPSATNPAVTPLTIRGTRTGLD